MLTKDSNLTYHRDTCPPLLSAPPHITARIQNQLRRLSPKGRVKKSEFYSTIKNEIASFAGKWMELEIIKLRGISQTQEDKSYTLSFLCGISRQVHTHTYITSKYKWDYLEERWDEREIRKTREGTGS